MPETEITVGLVLFILVVIGAITGAWWRVEHKVKEAKEAAYHKADMARTMADAAGAKADMAREELASHKLHVAEHYVSKQGHRESTDQVMKAISDLGGDVRGMRQRIDRFLDSERKTPPA